MAKRRIIKSGQVSLGDIESFGHSVRRWGEGAMGRRVKAIIEKGRICEDGESVKLSRSESEKMRGALKTLKGLESEWVYDSSTDRYKIRGNIAGNV